MEARFAAKSIDALILAGISVVGCTAGRGEPDLYFPPPGDEWESRRPAEVGMDSAKIAVAIQYANEHQTSMPTDPGQYLRDRFEGIPYQEIVGPVKDRGTVNGLVLRHGYIVAEWGDTRRVDMNFSVTKSYLSTVGGLAYDRGMIQSLDDSVGQYVAPELFASENNSGITWRHLLQQTSEWEGTLWGKPDAADRRRGIDRELQVPGTFWEYNDVRVNLLAYTLLELWRKPLPDLLREEIMDRIGATQTWEWHGYETSWTDIGGTRMQSVSGGGHWGGGLWASTRDHARFGYLALRNGRWEDEQIVSAEWMVQATTPVEIQPNYGFMWWLNTGRQQFPAAPESSFFALGAGSTSVIWVDPDHDLVAVTRWIDGSRHVNEFMGIIVDAIVE